MSSGIRIGDRGSNLANMDLQASRKLHERMVSWQARLMSRISNLIMRAGVRHLQITNELL